LNEDIYLALDRTALLLALDIFGPNADRRAIVDGLRATTARIIADRPNIDSPAGQTALVTLYAQLAMLGVQIDLDVPDTTLRASQPPLRGDHLPTALLDYSADLLPGGSSRPSPVPDITFSLGDSDAPADAVRVSGTAWTAAVGSFPPALRWQGTEPTGAMAAAAAAAPEGLRAAVPRIAERLDLPLPSKPCWRLVPNRHTEIDLSGYRFDGSLPVGNVDVISGGAITSAALYALLRMPLTAQLRIIEPDRLDLTNLNRYALALRSMIGWLKGDALKTLENKDIKISAVNATFSEATVPQLAPIAPLLLAGVDDIPSRWAAQRAGLTRWICVGSSSHDFVMVSAHPAGGACAGCVHTRDDPATGAIPTISFVSFWAGLIQALALTAHTAGHAPPYARTTHVWPFGLDNPRGLHQFRQDPAADCPIDCPASAGLEPLYRRP
jgi:hypothetical protein